MGSGLRSSLSVFFALFLLFLLAGERAEAQLFEPWPPGVKVTTPETIPGASFTIDFKIDVPEGVHLYKDKILFDFEEQTGARFEKAIFPPAVEIPDLADPGSTVQAFEKPFDMKATFAVTGRSGDPIRIKGTLSLMGCTDELCYPPHKEAFGFIGKALVDGTPQQAETRTVAEEPTEAEPLDVSWSDLLLQILGAFGLGIMLSLTPCVLPLVPITSAIIQRFSRGGSRASALYASCIYVFGLAITYAAAGVAVAFVGGAVRSFLNSPWVLVSIGVIFVVLSLSMFGLFDISMPSGLAGKLQQTSAAQANKKNRFALIIMGMIAGIVAGPCLTAPLAALLAWIAQTGSPVIGFVTMFSLAWGIGLLIILAGTFTSLVPRAGEWMEWFKKFFGFVMLWGALYFPRSLIPEEIYNAATFVLLVVAAVFLGGLDSLPSTAGWALRLKKLVGVFCLLGALFLGFHAFVGGLPQVGAGQAATVAGGEGGFHDGGQTELKKAMAEGQRTILFFTAPWCTICKPLKKETLRDPRVIRALEGIEALLVDFDGEQALVEKYHIPGPPTVVFIDEHGQEKEALRFSGFKTVDEFLDLLKRF